MFSHYHYREAFLQRGMVVHSGMPHGQFYVCHLGVSRSAHLSLMFTFPSYYLLRYASYLIRRIIRLSLKNIAPDELIKWLLQLIDLDIPLTKYQRNKVAESHVSRQRHEEVC